MDTIALLLITVAGIMQGSFVVPLKLTRRWEFENTWFLFCLIGFVILPLGLTILTVPQVGQVLATSSHKSIFLAALFGAGWGCGVVLFGLGVERLGVGLGLSIIVGLSSALGSIIPWIISPTKPLTYSVLLWIGVGIMLLGIFFCSRAGRLRETQEDITAGPGVSSRNRFATGLRICIACGVLVSFLNLGFVAGGSVVRQAESLGASPANAPNLLWLIIMGAGFLPNGIYCVRLMIKKRSWDRYLLREGATYLGWTFVMGLTWAGSVVIYGLGANKIGTLGPSLGWPILSSLNIVTSNLWGVAMGEWRSASSRAGRMMVVGIIILVLAVVVFGWSSTKV
jgi:L-rhamnose-H+ transport protein